MAHPSPPPPPPPLGAASRLDAGPAPTNGSPKTGVDIDWDDEDEATQVFDRTQEDALRSLLRSAPPPPPPPAAGMPAPRAPTPLPAAGMPAHSRGLPSPRPSAPPPPSLPRGPLPPPPGRVTSSMPVAPMPMAPPVAAALPTMMNRGATLSEPSPFGGTSRKPVIAVAAAVGVALVAAAVFLLLPKQGSLVVTVAGPGNKVVSEVEVFVDGQKRCSSGSTACQVKDLSAGIHLVKVTAPSYQGTADQAVKIVAGDEAVLNVSLTKGSAGTGINVRSEGRGLKLFVDGKEIGPLPQEVTDLSPGDHTVKIEGGDRYEPFEKSVTVTADQMFSLEPKLKVKKGLATIKPGLNADGSHVVLVSGSERRPVPQLPLAVDIPVDKPYSIVATKRGFQDFEQRLEFEDGQAERTFVIDMVPPVGTGGAVDTSSRSAPAPRAPRGAAAPAPAPVAAAPAAPKPAAGGTLNLNSIPASNVILDGKPLGPTPKTGIAVSPGNHTVIFVHAEHGRKAKSVNVTAGKTVPVVVKFP